MNGEAVMWYRHFQPFRAGPSDVVKKPSNKAMK